jgi:cell division protein FtsB
MKLKKILLSLVAMALFATGMISCNGGSQEEIATLQSQYDSIMKAYNQKKADFEDLQNVDEQKAAEIRTKDSIINVQSNQIRNSINGGNGGGNAKLKRQIAELQKRCDELSDEIEALKAENRRLREENEKMQSDLETANGTISNQNNEISELNQKLVAARTLLINDLTANPEKKKCGKSNKFKTTNKANAVERINISGKILPNTVVDPGTKTFYARITKGNNLVTNLGDEPKAFDMGGVDMLYTCEQDVEFYGQGRNFSMIWRKSKATNLDSGVYTVTVYNDGNEVGKANFTLK